MFEKFIDWAPSSDSIARLSQANKIIDDYAAQGFSLTLRQLYYQFVASDLIENSERSYKNLGSLISKGREAGLIDWDAIEDRNRGHESPYIQEDSEYLVNSLPRYLSFDLWKDQPNYVEVWVEKEALSGIVAKACDPRMVPYLACKGYLSSSEAYLAGKRFERARWRCSGLHIIHLGDHDPSGIDMTRDNHDRVNLFSNDLDVNVHRIALNLDQIEEFAPPPNPTKLSDSRASAYIRKFGRSSWELDALSPSVLVDLIDESINDLIDVDLRDKVITEERQAVSRLESLVETFRNLDE